MSPLPRIPFVLLLLLTPAVGADCIPFSEAAKHVGQTKCVSGRIVRVKPGSRGTTFFDFCDDYRLCPFTVVVFARDLKDVGDVRQLQGKQVEIHGEIKQYDGRAEIVLREARQLGGEAAQIPSLPKAYDVEKKGRYSAGKFSYPKSGRKKARKRQTRPIQTEEQTDPATSED